MKQRKDQVFKMRVDAQEKARLKRLADHYGLSPTGVIRLLLKREDDALKALKTQRGGAT